MNRAKRQIIAEKISSTVRVLELLGFEYQVSNPKYEREKGNRSPRVVYVDVSESHTLRIYNGIGGSTWANEPSGKPISEVKCIESLYNYLNENYEWSET